MRILIFGAGVLGSRYAAALHQAGRDITILARHERYQQIKQNGIILEAINTGERTVARVPVIETLRPEDAYDLALVMVKSQQIPSVLPSLAANPHIPSVLFLGNNVDGSEEMVSALGRKRVLLGFAGAAGIMEGEVIRFIQTKGNKTYAGELDGGPTPRFERIVDTFAGTPFPVKPVDDIDGWLKAHAAIVIPLALGVYMCAGDNYRMAKTNDALVLSSRGIQEGFRAFRRLGIPIRPKVMVWLFSLPEPLIVALMRLALNTDYAEIGLAGHANAARDEMKYLASRYMALVETSGEPLPSLRTLYLYANPNQPSITDGSRNLAVKWDELWRSLASFVIQLLLSILLIRLLFGRKKKRRRK